VLPLTNCCFVSATTKIYLLLKLSSLSFVTFSGAKMINYFYLSKKNVLFLFFKTYFVCFDSFHFNLSSFSSSFKMFYINILICNKLFHYSVFFSEICRLKNTNDLLVILRKKQSERYKVHFCNRWSRFFIR
jgi:hypothetical protein